MSLIMSQEIMLFQSKMLNFSSGLFPFSLLPLSLLILKQHQNISTVQIPLNAVKDTVFGDSRNGLFKVNQ